jgi:hypothetical protein
MDVPVCLRNHSNKTLGSLKRLELLF